MCQLSDFMATTSVPMQCKITQPLLSFSLVEARTADERLSWLFSWCLGGNSTYLGRGHCRDL